MKSATMPILCLISVLPVGCLQSNAQRDDSPDTARPKVEGIRQDAQAADPQTTIDASTAFMLEDVSATGDPAWDLYNAAQQRWQQDVQELLACRDAHLQDISRVTLSLQRGLLKLRAARIRWLLARDPARFVRDQGLARFIHFRWSEEDSETLREHDPSYALLEAQVEASRQRMQAHEYYAASRSALEELVRDPEFRETVARWTSSCEQVEQLLARSSHGLP